MEAYGLRKEADWIEIQVYPPYVVPERLDRIANIVKERSHVRVDKVRNTREPGEEIRHRVYGRD